MSKPIQYDGRKFYPSKTIVTMPHSWVVANVDKDYQNYVQFGAVCKASAKGAVKTSWTSGANREPVYAKPLPVSGHSLTNVAYGAGTQRERMYAMIDGRVYTARIPYSAARFARDMRVALLNAKKHSTDLALCKVLLGRFDEARGVVAIYLEDMRGVRTEVCYFFGYADNVRRAIKLVTRLEDDPRCAYLILTEALRMETDLKDFSHAGLASLRLEGLQQNVKESGSDMDGRYCYQAHELLSQDKQAVRVVLDATVSGGKITVNSRA